MLYWGSDTTSSPGNRKKNLFNERRQKPEANPNPQSNPIQFWDLHIMKTSLRRLHHLYQEPWAKRPAEGHSFTEMTGLPSQSA